MYTRRWCRAADDVITSQCVGERGKVKMSAEKLKVIVTDGDSGGDQLVGNTMLSVWDIVTVTIYFILVMAAGLYVSQTILKHSSCCLPLMADITCSNILG